MGSLKSFCETFHVNLIFKRTLTINFIAFQKITSVIGEFHMLFCIEKAEWNIQWNETFAGHWTFRTEILNSIRFNTRFFFRSTRTAISMEKILHPASSSRTRTCSRFCRKKTTSQLFGIVLDGPRVEKWSRHTCRRFQRIN